MNAAVRAVVRMAIAYNAEPYAIHEGYQGLIDGGDKIEKMGWDSVHGYLPVGGTIIGTARCKDFREKSGRRTATLHLIEAGIDALVVIGGDGSLTGADSLRAEWPELVKSLLDDGLISNEDALHFAHLTIVGLVGSIDNDMALTEYTIGAVSSLHRICESVDAIASTAMSHMRAFVVEVMGRHCGWLALMAAICTGADWLFVPERPPEGDDWETHMCDTLIRHRNTLSKRGIIVIVAEGAIDRNLKPITAEQVRILLTERCKFDTRVTQLGHVQRGGTPCFFDRYLGTIQGVAAVEAIMKATPDMPSPMIGFRGNQVQSIPLMEAVKSTHSISESISNRDFDKAVDLRSDEFRNMFDMYESSTHLEFSFSKQNTIVSKHEPIRIAIMHVGAPAAGMNAATRAAAMAAINKGHVALEIINGFPGLIRGEVSELTAERVEGWTTKGGSELGTNRDQPGVHLGMIAYQMQRHKIHALIIIGGFEAFTGICTLYENRSTYPAFMIPMVLIPATISNNVPGTEYSLGTDTALNVIVESCDRVKQSADASRRRVFVVEVQGGNSGCLAALGGLASGATAVYTPENGISLQTLQSDIGHLRQQYLEERGCSVGRVILRNENASNVYTTEVISNIIAEEGGLLFSSKTAVLGHLQQGGMPSPLDRYRGTRLGVNCVKWIEEMCAAAMIVPEEPLEPLPTRSQLKRKYRPRVYAPENESVMVIGIIESRVKMTPLAQLIPKADFKRRMPQTRWWDQVEQLVRVMAKFGQYPGEEKIQFKS
ncbi:6-phosphofructokinase [Ramicandelaber brevisporus]|nr:6-phosphofructokinase [Ramicandelaber brevisporus]